MAEYNFLQKLLHYVALANSSVLEATLDAELAFSKSKRSDQSQKNHVFVSGLARGGTTILMRSLYETGLFSSLTYADMPFVLAPNLWSKISGKSKKTIQAKERAHGDGILVDVDSPEALDEVFWRAFTGEQYIHNDGLSPCSSDEEIIEKYRNYISSILAHYPSDRYLSKNNNNILRFGSILQALPNAMLLVPFRDPLQHAHSLLTQHLLFCKKQAEDPFVRRYMSWLGHHEFGLEHKPFKVEGGLEQYSDTRTIEYWLQQWRNVYQFLLLEIRKYPKNTRCVSYELLCSETKIVWGALCKTLDVEGSKIPAMHEKVREVSSSTDESLLAEVGAIYQQLTDECRGALLV